MQALNPQATYGGDEGGKLTGIKAKDMQNMMYILTERHQE